MRDGGTTLSEAARSAGLKSLALVAWRDLDDPEAGGSELHAHEIARRWASAGLNVTVRTSAVAGAPERVRRDGYVAVRRSGRYQVFATAPADVVAGRLGELDGLVEVWNGMPFLSPLWGRLVGGLGRVTFLHHVHAEMWEMVLPSTLAAIGRAIESRLAPPLYKNARIVTLSESSRQEIIELLRMRPERVDVVEPGIDPRFSPAGRRSSFPLVLAVGRLVPVKRFDRLIGAMAELHERRPDARLKIVGEGYEREHLEQVRHDLGADGYVELPGRLSEDELLSCYREAWLLAATSLREGWGMTVSEAAACGTPAVCSRIAGHKDVVVEGESGLLCSNGPELEEALFGLIEDDELRQRLGKGAIERAGELSWEATAEQTLQVVADEKARTGWLWKHNKASA